MYNKELYSTVTERAHQTLRKKFDTKAVLERFTDPKTPPVMRMAIRLRELFRQENPVILSGQRIVFIRTVTDVPGIFTDEEWAKIRSGHFIHELGYISNICADYGLILGTGLEKRKELIDERLKTETDPRSRDFLVSAHNQIETVENLSDRYLSEAERLGRKDIVESLRQVPRYPARSFREALQFFRILHYSLWAEGEYHNTVGRFDYYMWPYLKTDLEKGIITYNEAESLLEEFFISFNIDSDMYVGVQLGDNGQSMMLGGVDENGNDSYNPLSEMCLRTSCELKLIDPKINLRVSKSCSLERYVEGTKLTKAGLGFPQYSNDDVVIPGLVRLGYDIKAARNYSVAACWEFITAGVAMDIPNIGALSFPLIVEKTVKKHLANAASFDGFMDEIRNCIRSETDRICEKVKNLFLVPAPFYSVLMDGCIENGHDISDGSIYNNYGIHGTGISTASDSLWSIKKHVFDSKDTTAEQFVSAIDNDFRGQEELLHKVRYEDSKTGDNDRNVDRILCRLVDFFSEALEGKRNERGGIFRAGTGSAMFYLWHAAELGASPDGRRKGEPFGTNFSPSLYVRSKGPYSVISSFTKPDVIKAINGGPLTMEFHSSTFDTDEGILQVAGLVKKFIDLGGHQLQLNSINRDRLKDAQLHPENYKNLIVRIWGWSAYFVELDKEYQDHLIARQEFNE